MTLIFVASQRRHQEEEGNLGDHMGNKDSMDLLFILCSFCSSPQLLGLDINLLKSLDATERKGGLQLYRVLQGF